MRVFRPESALELGEWIRSSRDRFEDEGVPVITGAVADRPPGELATLPRWSVSTSRLSEVGEFRPRDLTITVGGGMRLSALARTIEEAGLWLPVEGFPEDRSVGGWVASAPGGEFDGSFGPVRRHVLACELLLWDGRSTSWGRPVMKNVAGYEIPKLICGSRARIGIVTAVTLRLWPRPRVLRRFELEGEKLREPVGAFNGAPRFDGIRWRSPAGGKEAATAVGLVCRRSGFRIEEDGRTHPLGGGEGHFGPGRRPAIARPRGFRFRTPTQTWHERCLPHHVRTPLS